MAPTYAAPGLANTDLSVVGPPTLSASTVNSIFSRLGSPMTGVGALVEQTSRQTNIDDAFALAVWWTETNDGATGVGLADRNPGSVRGSAGYSSAYDGYTIYPSYAAAVAYWFNMLKNLYVVDRGLSTVYAISHPYVGTSSSPLWAGKVVALMLRYRGEAPPPPPPTPTVAPVPPVPTISPVILAHHRRVVDPGAAANTIVQAQPPHVGARFIPPTQTQQTQQTQSSTSTLSATATALIVIFALLLALAIALWARTLSTQSLFFRLPSHPLDEPRTDALAYTEPAALPTTSPLYPFPNIPPSTGKLRRTLLLPAQPDARPPDLPEETALSSGRRSTGLLARYGNPSQK